jgi:hypothetical protein
MIPIIACSQSESTQNRSVQGSDAGLQTWWHANAELNDSTAVAAGSVRRSTRYDVRVATRAAPDVLHDSFTYMSLPRSGRDKETDLDDDGAEFAADAHMTMSWSSFLYETDTWVEIELKHGPAHSSADEVTIRPTTLNFHKELVNERTIRILVPYLPQGYRFSVEFKSEQLTSYKNANGTLTVTAEGNRAVHTEPRNAMLIFAEPKLTGADVDRLIPNPALNSIYYPEQGKITNLHEVTEEVIYFHPGTYYMDANYHAYLRSSVRWIYLAPGAYVKGAFQFRRGATDFKVTGFGVLSGEQYVYEPDRTAQYLHLAENIEECHATCVKMLEFESGSQQQQLTLHGLTLSNPPYHSFVVHGDFRHFMVNASQTKQVGAWYWQTDGPELYDGSSLQHSFVHANDDALKLYASRVTVADVVIWKAENGPAIQWGWAPRTIDDVHIDGVDVIHNRMYLDSHNSCIINSARHFLIPHSTRLADPTARVSNVFLRNIRSEGMNLCAMRLYALASWERIRIENLWIERWNELDLETQASKFEALSNAAGERVFIGDELNDRSGLAIENYTVAGERISKAADNWRSYQPGRLDFDASLWENWDAR